LQSFDVVRKICQLALAIDVYHIQCFLGMNEELPETIALGNGV
jgi:hypothetical protein